MNTNMTSIISAKGERTNQKVPVERLAYRLNDLVKALGVSRRTIERLRSAGRFPRPDQTIGRMPLWRKETIDQWLVSQNRSSK
jgi:predicted DNA-binding transcriptional regulator AlpA